MAWYWIVLLCSLSASAGFVMGAAWVGLCRANDEFDRKLEDRHGT